MLLSESRTRVRRYVDDEDTTNPRWQDTEINDELKSAQHIVWRRVGDRSNLWTSETVVTTNSAGVADLTIIKPIRIISVAITAGSISRWLVKQARLVDGLTNVPTTQSLRIAYVPRPAFPTLDANPFLWGPGGSGAGFDTELLDRTLCLLAASAAKVKDGEINQQLEMQKAEALGAIDAMVSIPRFTAIPLMSPNKRTRAPMYFVLTAPDTLQLVA